MDRTIADLTEYILSPRGRLWPGPNSEPKSAARRAHRRHSPTAVRAHSRPVAISRLDMPRRRADRQSTALGPSDHQPPSGRRELPCDLDHGSCARHFGCDRTLHDIEFARTSQRVARASG
jgi:hypothetical protein